MPLALIAIGFAGGLWVRSELDTDGGITDLILPAAVVAGGAYAYKKGLFNG